MSENALREKTCFLTGHRDIPSTQYAEVVQKLERAVERLVARGVVYFGVGGALGFDTLAALTVLRVREQCPAVRLVLVLPCKDHHFSWPGKDKKIFEQIAKQADKVVYATEKYYSGCMYKRNRMMAEQSGWCICYMERATGGTAYAVSYAQSVGVQIVNLADEE
ncbi:MAG: SLOG family protein [Oscillospiraceae bacterium]|nr:SLOG family protein [Oscillospiraceae bacterium]